MKTDNEVEVTINVSINDNPLDSVLKLQHQFVEVASEMASFYKDNAQSRVWDDFAKTYSWLSLIILEPSKTELFELFDYRDTSMKKLLNKNEGPTN